MLGRIAAARTAHVGAQPRVVAVRVALVVVRAPVLAVTLARRRHCTAATRGRRPERRAVRNRAAAPAPFLADAAGFSGHLSV
jgi:hypothetical protein